MRIYLDYNATAPVRDEVRVAVEPVLFGEDFGNASSVHWAGQRARRALEQARTRVAARTGRHPSEVIFTGGGTEANNLALAGVLAHPERPRHLVISAVEHPAVAEPARRLAASGVRLTVLPVDRRGELDLDALDAALASGAGLVSIMAVNNETGVVHPLEGILARTRAAGVPVHVDAVQAAGRMTLPLEADLITISGHKLGGLKGAGALLTRKKLGLVPQQLGGPQERGLRAGTEAVAPAVALALALELSLDRAAEEQPRVRALRDRLETALLALGQVEVVGAESERVGNTVTALFHGLEADLLLEALDLEGIAASSGSACSSGSLEPSPVLLAMGFTPREARSAIRFSLGYRSTADELEAALPRLGVVVRRLRALS